MYTTLLLHTRIDTPLSAKIHCVPPEDTSQFKLISNSRQLVVTDKFTERTACNL